MVGGRQSLREDGGDKRRRRLTTHKPTKAVLQCNSAWTLGRRIHYTFKRKGGREREGGW